jgi:beta-galactosidase
MKMTKKGALLFVTLTYMLMGYAQPRVKMNLADWQFSHDMKSWETVSVPHDWAIGGPFDKKWDLQYVAIEQNGEKEKTEKSGRSGALPWIGEGHYRCHVDLSHQSFGRAVLCFDGAMSEPVVKVNGQVAGYWAYGYNAFRIDVTSYVRKGDNLIEVDLKNIPESSRWYPGGGLYRPVNLLLTGGISLNDWGTYFRTMSADGQVAHVEANAEVNGFEGATGLKTVFTLTDAKGTVVSTATDETGNNRLVSKEMTVDSPHLWSPESPYLYTLATALYQGDQLLDRYTCKVGIRTIAVSKEHGFQLNGVSRKIQGVCLHHDLGPLGAAVNKAALIRQIRILKDMGCDAIRTSHNMPSTLQMEVCDSMGVMVMAESFDMWIYPKCKNGYARFFKTWSDDDITNLVLNHRNHPSIIMWSIGNEIPEQWSQEGVEIARHLQNICHQLDPSRPVTQGMDRPDDALKSGFAQVMDIPGFNYRVHKYDKAIKSLPQGFLLGSETASTVSSRGVYKFPVEVSDKVNYADGQCSSYDTEYCYWSNLPDEDFTMQADRTWTIGQFVWTGFDYLGEPTPYDEYWPSRSSYFGICDLAGLPKDRYYLYRSVWNKTAHTIHLLPHWTFPGREGQVTPVYCYTDYPTAELFVNGKSQGRVSKRTDAHQIICNPDLQMRDTSALDRYRLRWNNVKYKPGNIKVVVYDEKGKKCGEQRVRTAGKPARLLLDADRASIHADGNDLAYITITMVDQQGVLVPYSQDELEFQVMGAGAYKAACNGDATSLESFTQPQMKLFNGQLVVVVQAAHEAGSLILKVCDKDNRKIIGQITIEVVK